MKIVYLPRQMQQLCRRLRRRGYGIGFVPTMGAFHAGHLSLIERARRENDVLAVSIFVNPMQFGPHEDFKKYPRSFQEDARLCRKAGADLLFAPRAEQMYPAGHATQIDVGGLSDTLCGRFRPGHFRGVATVVAKLFVIVSPQRAYFGQKDAQQAAVIKRMVRDLHVPVRIIVMPIVREDDGLAMSSRNRYLSSAQRFDAAILFRGLCVARSLARSGVRDRGSLIAAVRRTIATRPSVKVEYIDLVDPDSLTAVRRIKGNALLAAGVRIGATRLIDNVMLKG